MRRRRGAARRARDGRHLWKGAQAKNESEGTTGDPLTFAPVRALCAALGEMREPLLRAVAVVAPDAERGAPAVLAHASLCGGASHDCLPLGAFAFPEQLCEKAAHLDPSFYTFVLTDGAGERTFGHCVRFLPPGVGARWPAVLCALSRHDWHATFRDLLSAMLPTLGAALADDMLRCKLLSPGCSLRARLEELCALELPPHVTLPLIANGPLNADDEAVATLLKRVPPSTVAALLCSLLHERRIVVTGSELESVSAVVHACAALLCPLTWQHLFLPVLPAGLLDYVSAPMPLLIGVLAPAYAAVLRLRLPVEHLVVLDCDTGAIEGAAADVEELPPALLHKLEASLEQGAGSGAVAHLMSRILGSYKAHIHSTRSNTTLPDGALVAGSRFFDHAAWAGQSRTLARFRNALRHSQHFEAFICDQMSSAQVQPPAAFSGTVETAAHRMADMLSSARSSYKSLRDAESENNGPRASSGRSWLQRRPLGPSNANALEAAPPAEKPPAAVMDAEKDRALVEAAVAAWQRNVSLPLREAAQQTAALAGAAPAEHYMQMQPGGTDQQQYELMVLRSERDVAVAQRDSLLRERDELLAVVAAALNPLDASEPVAPAVAAQLAPLQARLIAVTTERDLLAAERAACKC